MLHRAFAFVALLSLACGARSEPLPPPEPHMPVFMATLEHLRANELGPLQSTDASVGGDQGQFFILVDWPPMTPQDRDRALALGFVPESHRRARTAAGNIEIGIAELGPGKFRAGIDVFVAPAYDHRYEAEIRCEQECWVQSFEMTMSATIIE